MIGATWMPLDCRARLRRARNDGILIFKQGLEAHAHVSRAHEATPALLALGQFFDGPKDNILSISQIKLFKDTERIVEILESFFFTSLRLMNHPDIRQLICFPLPGPNLPVYL